MSDGRSGASRKKARGATTRDAARVEAPKVEAVPVEAPSVNEPKGLPPPPSAGTLLPDAHAAGGDQLTLTSGIARLFRASAARDPDGTRPLPVVLGLIGGIGAILVLSGALDGALAAQLSPGMLLPLKQVLAGSGLLIAVGWAFAASFGEAYLAALWITAPRLPGLLAGAWLLAYLAPPLADAATFPATAKLGLGLFVAVMVWLVITVPFRRLGLAPTSNAQTYGEIVVRYNQLRARCEACSPGQDGPRPVNAHTGHNEAATQLRLVQTMLGLPSTGMTKVAAPALDEGALAWATGAGYVAAWEALNRADEALIDVEPSSAVIGEALHDMLRLTESSIVNADRMQDALRAAVRHFDREADELYFYPQRRRREDRSSPQPSDGASPHSLDRRDPGNELVPKVRGTSVGLIDNGTSLGSTRTPDPTGTESIEDAAARAVIREVRHAVNDYRDSRRGGLIRARNRLLRLILVTGIAADILLGLVILEGVQTSLLATASAFFLIGGVVGLFNRLRIEGESTFATSADYGLFDARLLHTILISGLAGVGGVFLMSAAPTAAAILSNDPAQASPPDLASVFNPSVNRIGILVAAVFGLTPDLVIGKLRQQTDSLKHDLSTSEAAVPEHHEPSKRSTR